MKKRKLAWQQEFVKISFIKSRHYSQPTSIMMGGRMMKKEPERYIYDEQESQETTRLISEAYQSGYVDMPDQESSSPAE
ncbi:hypothetical protein FE205_10475 [Bacillus subtilis]|nr:hypothetical protein [Bacillus subtilis]NP_390821.3 conserved protein of unknown function [Bacillus subtilis subsp. subtilis str. 168]AYK60199.1 hypothetical protein D9C14_01850 [Bacillus subtilis subsp. subtilis]KAA0938083.1 hypothetical protein FQ086_11170 [Bacillus sp. ANT_WA51]MDR4254630.1 hypothetical protein [Bacillus subtilis subsp. subtilis NCIB 3610 = ATCC 6051 = DSM 10]MDR4279195.1 hypothetical protein [Bacillus subtilis KCTC 1028 = ATCC 6051a]NOV07551.1 hypothetical protein [Bac